MAKIDCSVTVNFVREYYRMCKHEECNECPASVVNNGTGYECEKLLYNYPEVAVKIMQKWSDEHPVKTRLDDLKEKYPNVPLNDGFPRWMAPFHLGYCGECKECRMIHCVENCWNEPVDGGAAGKAVE